MQKETVIKCFTWTNDCRQFEVIKCVVCYWLYGLNQKQEKNYFWNKIKCVMENVKMENIDK